MKLIDFYNFVIRKGIEKDPRPKSEIAKLLARERREYAKLRGVDRSGYDRARLRNPYADTRILYGDPGKEVKTVMVGIDMEGAELLLADRLNEHGAAIDLVMAHHPEGIAWASLYDVMGMQALILNKFGLALEVAQDQMKERIAEVRRSLAPANHFRSVDIARLLDMPYLCAHTPADNHVQNYLQARLDREKPRKLSHVIALLKTIPEYIDGMRKNAGPKILIGDEKDIAGKIFVDMTGGTEGSKRAFARLSQAGVGTIVGMHLSEEHFKNAKDEHINVIIAGHIASDNLGVNLLLDSIDKEGPLHVIPCSGFIRVRR